MKNAVISTVLIIVTMILFMGWKVHEKRSIPNKKVETKSYSKVQKTEEQKRIDYLQQKEKALY